MLLKVQLVADLPLREALRTLLDREEDLVIIRETPDGDTRAPRPDLIIIDGDLEHDGALATVRATKADRPRSRILVLAGRPTQPFVLAALTAGASGIVSKVQPRRELVGAIRVVGSGGCYLCPDLITIRASADAARSRLTDRELVVYERLLLGRPHRTIADELQVSEHTIAALRGRVLRKLQLRDGADLLCFAVRHGSAA